jgi:hypothetical protein
MPDQKALNFAHLKVINSNFAVDTPGGYQRQMVIVCHYCDFFLVGPLNPPENLRFINITFIIHDVLFSIAAQHHDQIILPY